MTYFWLLFLVAAHSPMAPKSARVAALAVALLLFGLCPLTRALARNHGEFSKVISFVLLTALLLLLLLGLSCRFLRQQLFPCN